MRLGRVVAVRLLCLRTVLYVSGLRLGSLKLVHGDCRF